LNNEANSYPVPESLFKKIIKRHEKLKDNPDAKFYHFHESYNVFQRFTSWIIKTIARGILSMTAWKDGGNIVLEVAL
jgi:hypothetical protein